MKADRKSLRDQFFKLHPLCCFCGGSRPATTEDHQPARSIFDERNWPEGYSFPACSECNATSRSHENVFAILTRLGPSGPRTESQRKELHKYLDAAKNNFPGLLHPMSTREKRAFYKAEGLKLPQGALFSELDMCALDARLTEDSTLIILRKLLCALHYKHTNDILPPSGKMFIRWMTNAYTHRGELFADFLSLLSGRPQLVRNRVTLNDQFDYTFVVDPNGSSFSAYFCMFRDSIAGYGIVMDSSKIDTTEFDAVELYSPLA
ncbi:hypothetical protein ACQR1I_13635 [Bradyrhizobium sp. HKCCYLS2038]|uniref:hypothetical protein n=1 Tax=unclassified Bradyrhizobium TaxID=2631580 RepID=UPI003EBA33BE